MEEKKSYLQELKGKVQMWMSVRQDLFKEKIQSSFSVLSSALCQVSLQVSQSVRQDLTKKFIKKFEQSQPVFTKILSRIDYFLKKENPSVAEISSTMDVQGTQQQSINELISEAQTLLQNDQGSEKLFELNIDVQSIKNTILNLVNSNRNYGKDGINCQTSSGSILPETGNLIKFVEKEQYIEVYDIPQLTRKKIPTSVKFHDCSAIFQVGDSIYVAGGEDSNTQELQDDLFQVYIHGECVTHNKMKYKRGMLSLAGCINFLLATGGCDYDDNPFNYVEKFRFVTLEWTELPPLLNARFGHASCIAFNVGFEQEEKDDNSSVSVQATSEEVFYVFSGAITESNDCNYIQRFKSGSTTWQSLNGFMPLPEGRYYFARVVPSRNQILLFGGLDNKDLAYFTLNAEMVESKYNLKSAPESAFNCPVVFWKGALYTISDIQDGVFEMYKMDVNSCKFEMCQVMDI